MNAAFPLLLVAWLATPALAEPNAPNTLHRVEARLLHQALRPIDLGSNLHIFEPRSGEWLSTNSSDPPAARVLVVYLWSAASAVALSELPTLREIARRVEAHHDGDARFLFVAEGVSAAQMKAIPTAPSSPTGQPYKSSKTENALPPLPYFLDSAGSIPEALRQGQIGAEMPLPVTLLLDEQHVVRHALVGSLVHRRSELVSAISDLLYQIRNNARGGRLK